MTHSQMPLGRQSEPTESQRSGSLGAPRPVWNPDHEPGNPLAPALRASLEPRFSADFSQVRVHTSQQARASAQALGASAYAVGNHIVAGPGNDLSWTPEGRHSLSHELAHVVQQRRFDSGITNLEAESAAGRAADAAVELGAQTVLVEGGSGPTVTRQSKQEFESRRQQFTTALSAARRTGEWQQVAEELNGLSHQDMQFRLADLSDVEVGYLHLGALDNPRLGAESAIALETIPGHPRVSTTEPVTSRKAQQRPSETIGGFRQQIRTVAAQRLAANGQNLQLWRDFLDFELSPEQLMSQTLTMEARQLQVDARKGGSQTRELADQWSYTRNPLSRELLEHNIHGQWRACTGCHVSNQAWALTPQDTRSWQTPIQQMAAVEPGGGSAGNGPRSASGTSASELDTRLARIAPFLQELGPQGYKVLPANEFGRNRSPVELGRVVGQSIAQRILDYQLLAGRIRSGQVDYRELRPVIDELLPRTSTQVRALVEQEFKDFDAEHSRADTLAQIAGIALLLLAVFPPTSLFAIGVGVAAGSTLVVAGSERHDRGKDLQLAAGARDVVDPALQGQADAMVVSGVVDMVTGALAIAGAITGLRARIQSEGRLGALAVKAGSTVTEAEFTVTFAADGQSYVATSRRHPGCFVIVDADGATGFVIQNGKTVKVGHRAWSQAEANPVTNAGSANQTAPVTLPATARPALLAQQTPRIRISTGAFRSNPSRQMTDPFSGEVLGERSASAQTPRSVITAVRADEGEAAGWRGAVIERGEIGLQAPTGSNVPGGDFFTARIDPYGQVDLLVTDVKLSTVGKFPAPATAVKPTWMAELEAAIQPGRLNLGDPVLENSIRAAFSSGRVRIRQLNADYSPSGGGTITGY